MIKKTRQKPEEPARKDTPIEPLLLTVKQVIAMLQIGRAKIYSMINSGELLSITVVKSRLIPRTAVNEWLEHKIQEARAEQAKADQPPYQSPPDFWRPPKPKKLPRR